MTALGRSGLETPSYVFMAVFFAFVLLSIIVDRVKERCLEWLSENGREGLKAAFTTMVNEVMLLGFISLILTLVEESLSKFCVDEDVYRRHWIPIELVDDCDDCFHNTRRLSEDFDWKKHRERHCQGYEKDYFPPEHDYKEGRDDDHPHLFRRRLLASSGEPSVCKDGEVQFVSAKALHEVHTCIFLIAVVHVVVVALMVLIATFRVKWWKRWKREDDTVILRIDERTWRVESELKPERQTRRRPPTRRFAIEKAILATLRIDCSNDPEQDHVPGETSTTDGLNLTLSLLAHDDIPREKRDLNAFNLSRSKSAIRLRREHDNRPAEVSRERNEVARRTSRTILPSRRTQSEPDVPQPQITLPATRKQWTFAFWKQWFRPINKCEIRILRCAFILEHGQGENVDFERYLFKSFDDDIGEIVKIPVVGWFGIIVGYTLWAPMRFSGWPVLAVVLAIETAVTVICTKLVTIVLILTKEEKIHKLNERVFWWSKPKLLFPLIRVVLFINSVVFSLYLFVLWQYGAQSCALVEKIPGAGKNSILRIAGPLIFVFNLFCFFHTSWILLPLYTVTVHMGSTHFSRHLLPPDVLAALHRLLERRKVKRLTNGTD